MFSGLQEGRPPAAHQCYQNLGRCLPSGSSLNINETRRGGVVLTPKEELGAWRRVKAQQPPRVLLSFWWVSSVRVENRSFNKNDGEQLYVGSSSRGCRGFGGGWHCVEEETSTTEAAPFFHLPGAHALQRTLQYFIGVFPIEIKLNYALNQKSLHGIRVWFSEYGHML